MHAFLIVVSRFPLPLCHFSAFQVPYGQIGTNGLVALPPCLPLTTSSLDPRGAYLLDDSVGIMLWLGGNLPPAVAQQLVGAEAANSPDISQVSRRGSRIRSVLATEHPLSLWLSNQ